MTKGSVLLAFLMAFLSTFIIGTKILVAQEFVSYPTLSPIVTPTPTPSPTPLPTPRADITQKTEEVSKPLENLLKNQNLGPLGFTNFVKYAIRGSVAAGVPANTIVLLLLLPVIAFVIALSRNIVGIRGFGIFLPAALSVVFVATGPIVGIGLFLVIIVTSTIIRMSLRKLKIKLQYLPRMSMMLLFVVVGVLGVLFLAPYINKPDLANVSIFPVLVLILLVEDFTRVQLGKSVKTAVNLTIETLILALTSFIFLTSQALQEFALMHPEELLLSIFVLNIILGKYVGLRLLEIWRFRKLISQ